MRSVLTVILFIGWSSAAPVVREKKADTDPWLNVKNPCLNNPAKKIYFPHPTDGSKFIQCDMFGRMYIVQCPAGEKYDPSSESCTTGAIAILVTQPAGTSAVTILLPMTTTMAASTTMAATTQQSNQNPCTNANIAAGKVYFAHPQDPTIFIQCDLLGTQLIVQCQSGLVWDQTRLSCVYNINAGSIQSTTLAPATAGTGTTLAVPTTTAKNPCTPLALTTDKLFHPHPDPSKFYQCDYWGDVYEVACPPNLTWNDYAKTCSSPYLPGGNVVG